MQDIIRKIRHGEIITEPGVYEMPMGWYHSDCCDGPSVSSTGLRTIVNQTPKAYWDSSYLNPNAADDSESEEAKHFRIGRAGHLLLLEPENFAKQVVTRPAAFDSWRSKEAKRWRADAILEGKTVLDPAEMLQVQGVAASLREHHLHRDGILDGQIEASLIWKDEKSGIWLKARPDAIPFASNDVSDLKIMADPHPDAAERSVRRLGYDVQMALVGIGMEVLLKREVEEYQLICVGSKRPHDLVILTVAEERIDYGRRRLRKALTVMAECLKSGYWPSYEEYDGVRVSLSEFEKQKIISDTAAGRLPKEF